MGKTSFTSTQPPISQFFQAVPSSVNPERSSVSSRSSPAASSTPVAAVTTVTQIQFVRGAPPLRRQIQATVPADRAAAPGPPPPPFPLGDDDIDMLSDDRPENMLDPEPPSRGEGSQKSKKTEELLSDLDVNWDALAKSADPSVKHELLLGEDSKNVDLTSIVLERNGDPLRSRGVTVRKIWKEFLSEKAMEPSADKAGQPAVETPPNPEVDGRCVVKIPQEFARITAENEALRNEVIKTVGKVAENAAFLCIFSRTDGHTDSTQAVCLACHAAGKGDDKLRKSTKRGWANGNSVDGLLAENIRKQFSDHCGNSGHVNNVSAYAAREVKKARGEAIEQKVATPLTPEVVEELAPIFDSVYSAMHSNMTYPKVAVLVDLLKRNGVDLGQYQESLSSHRRIAKFLSKRVRDSLKNFLLASDAPFSISIDESTSNSQAKCLVICLRTLVNGQAANFFVDIIEIGGKATASNVYKTLRKSLESLGLDEVQLKSRLVGITTDGATVMTGKFAGVVTRLSRDIAGGKLLTLHCNAHMLELVLGDAKKSQPGVEFLLETVKAVNKIYRNSSVLADEVRNIAEENGLKLLKFLDIIETRWANSTYRALFNFLHSHNAIVEHMSHLENYSPQVKKKLQDLKSIIASREFMESLLLFMELLEPFVSVSLALQRADIGVVEAAARVDGLRTRLNQIGGHIAEEWTSRGFSGGEPLPSFRVTRGPDGRGVAFSYFRTDWGSLRNAVKENGEFGKVRLGSNRKFKRIHFPDLIAKMDVSLCQRFLQQREGKLIKTCSVLSAEMIKAANFPEYGSQALDLLSKETTLVPDKQKAAAALHQFVSDRLLASQLKDAPPDLHSGKYKAITDVLLRIEALSPTSAECERFFSLMNRIHTRERSRFKTRNVHDVMMVIMNGPPPAIFNARAAVRAYYSQKKPRSSTTTVILTSEDRRCCEILLAAQKSNIIA